MRAKREGIEAFTDLVTSNNSLVSDDNIKNIHNNDESNPSDTSDNTSIYPIIPSQSSQSSQSSHSNSNQPLNDLPLDSNETSSSSPSVDKNFKCFYCDDILSSNDDRRTHRTGTIQLR
jgi:hypothetical protein